MGKIGNFGDVFPPRNLGEATPWGREVEKRIDGIEKHVENTRQRVDNGNRNTSVRAEVQARQTQKLAEQQDTLEEVVEGLQGVVGDLAGVVEGLQATQDALAAVVAAIPLTQSYSDSVSDFSVPASVKNQITINIPVPEGKTRASVLAMGQAFWWANGTSQAGVAGWYTWIAGVPGSYGVVVPMNMDTKFVSYSQSRELDVSSLALFQVTATSDASENNGREDFHTAELHVMVTFS